MNKTILDKKIRREREREKAKEMHTESWYDSITVINRLKYLNIHERIIFKRILRKYNWKFDNIYQVEGKD
jgi:hypothetical protein